MYMKMNEGRHNPPSFPRRLSGTALVFPRPDMTSVTRAYDESKRSERIV
ncbi:MAG: hypothetical protein BSOLF_0339 [Candidatus Carbobacillus altaicus]|uniref:Uncharacterized protein n=1 Tax=Candidatus Carbonibacillus altaicus TaxID=2163959 RepID=A0A2R6Y0Y6_9BACL|nr:MAG: hypothetical protein BSOLF_0339 [Candidatus Carbobacillus altaicus]